MSSGGRVSWSAKDRAEAKRTGNALFVLGVDGPDGRLVYSGVSTSKAHHKVMALIKELLADEQCEFLRELYRKNAPKGYMGDASRGASMGRFSINKLTPEYSGDILVAHVLLDDGGYDFLGTYFGIAPETLMLWFCVTKDGRLDEVVRGSASDVRKILLIRFPRACVVWVDAAL